MRSYTILRLGAADTEAYRTLRLEGLREAPEAFGAAWEEEAEMPLSFFAGRVSGNAVFAARHATGALGGMVGVMMPDRSRTRHKGLLWGMYVRAAARGQGLGDALLAQVLEFARARLELLHLTVTADNHAALRLYERAGFVAYGREPRALKLADRYLDEILMQRAVP